METGLKINEEQVQGKTPVTVMHLRGWLDAQSEEQLLAAARDAYEKGSRSLLLDLSEVDTLTSAGMRAIQKVHRLYHPSSEQSNVERVKMCNAPPQIYHVLGITGFLQTIPNYESTQAALDSFEG